jgi:hypothetical protein
MIYDHMLTKSNKKLSNYNNLLTKYEGTSFCAWTQQARLPLRLGGCGLRRSSRVVRAAYWARRADCLPDLSARFPEHQQGLVSELARLGTLDANELHSNTDCLVAA